MKNPGKLTKAELAKTPRPNEPAPKGMYWKQITDGKYAGQWTLASRTHG